MTNKPITPETGNPHSDPASGITSQSGALAAGVEPSPIPPEILKIIESLHTQDNRITANPLFAVQQKRVIGGLESGYEDGWAWVGSAGEIDDADRISELNARFDEGESEPDGCRRVGYIEKWEFVTGCLTEEGCKQYLRLDGHNLREPRIYAYGGYRNVELEALRKWLMNLRSAKAIAAPTAPAEPVKDRRQLVFAYRTALLEKGSLSLDSAAGRAAIEAEEALLTAIAAAPQAAPAAPEEPARRVYLVATGEVHDGQETYTRHDDAPPPLCDAERLFSAPTAPAEPGNAAFTFSEATVLVNKFARAAAFGGDDERTRIGRQLVEALAAAAPRAAPTAPAEPTDTVPVPTNPDQAAAMTLIGEAWLRQHAPERLAAAAPQAEPQPLTWYEGPPPFPQDQEWVIAETEHGGRVVIKSLDEGREHKGSYAFHTDDGTYIKAEVIKRWMQFPDCEYLPPAGAEPQPLTDEQCDSVIAELGLTYLTSASDSNRSILRTLCRRAHGIGAAPKGDAS